jgi:ABC-2 type transport system permease protein
MIRYLRLYAAFVKFSVMRSAEFRLDFFFRVVMDLLFYVVQITFFYLLFRNTESLGGWNWSQVFVFVTGYLTVDAIQMTLFSNNFFWFPTVVTRGDLDYHLVRPVSPLFMVTMRDFATNSFLNLICALGLMAFALHHYFSQAPAVGTWESVALGLSFVFWVLIGTLVHAALQLLFLIPVFWTHSARGFEQAFFTLHRFAERPHQIFGSGLRLALLTILPFAAIASLPAHIVFGPNRVESVIQLAVITTSLALVVAWAWRTGLRAYSSASS